MKPTIAVIAGNKKEFNFFVHQCNPQGIFKYISKPDDFRGIRWSAYIKYGTYEDRKDIGDIYYMLYRYFYQ